MRLIISVFLVLCSFLKAEAQLNIQFRSQLAYGTNNELANIGGYVDSTGKEYALVGCEAGLSIVNVTNPAAPVQVALIPGVNNFWREVKVWGKYAYVTTEASGTGLQIVNLGKLPGTITAADYKYWKGTGAILNVLSRIHSLHIDNGYAYLNGTRSTAGGYLFGGATLIVSLSDPWNPTYVGNTQSGFNSTQQYVHDCYVRNDTLWGAHIYGGIFSVINVANKSAPVLIQTQATPGAFTHNAWLNTSGARTLFTTDEVTNSVMAAYDVTNPANPVEIDRIQLNPGSNSIVHNTHIKNNYAIVSWYTSGVAIVDVARPDNMIITGYYDTYPQSTGGTFNGCWGVYPFLPSGNLVASDINNGLFVLTPTYVRGCYLEGTVNDSCTGSGIPNVTVTITGGVTKQGKITGIYKTGIATAGTYSVTFSKAGYLSKTINGVVLNNGIVNNLNVTLKRSSVVSLDIPLISGVTCNGGNNGSINASASGGTTPYSWLWSGGSVTEDRINLQAGNYTLTVTDAVGCKSSATYVVSEPAAINVVFSSLLPSCQGENDGSITAYISGGTSPYQYQWSNPGARALRLENSHKIIYMNNFNAIGDTITLSNIEAGTYSLQITDTNNCQGTFQYILPTPQNSCFVNLHLKVFLEGFYRGNSTQEAVADPVNSPSICDSIIVSLAADSSFTILASDTGTIDVSGNGIFTFPGELWGNNCYVVIRHRNSLETWSASPIYIHAPDLFLDISAGMQTKTIPLPDKLNKR